MPAKQPSQGVAQGYRRRDPREPRRRAAQASARARHRRHDLLAARHGHEPPHRRLQREPGLVAGVQRDDPSRLHALPRQFHRRVPVAAVAGRVAGQLHRRARALREGIRFRRLQSQSRSVGRLLDRAAAHRPLVVQVLREDGRARRAGDGARERVVQSRASTAPARTTSMPIPPRSCSSSWATCSRISRP